MQGSLETDLSNEPTETLRKRYVHEQMETNLKTGQQESNKKKRALHSGASEDYIPLE